MQKKPENKKITRNLLTTGDIARYCETSVKQVNRWIQRGELEVFQNPGGHYRITKEKFREFLERNKMPVVKDFFRSSRKRILIADDDAAVIKAYSLLLKNHYDDVEIETASDGYEALLKTGGFRPDLLILDIRMPKIDGLEVCRSIKKDPRTSGIKIIMLSARGQEKEKEEGLKAGADRYITKPFNYEELIKAMEELLEN